ncbi:MAG: 4a-hydroxytetrahydrobiopterin dehydratase [Deltaproteobacteria bacterium]|nr:MAG: 4a-hydroxytetrahydrobiopterin dehydratase [Deltaproteobacteria bacterium]
MTTPAKRRPLERDAIEAALRELPGWRYEAGALGKSFVFGSFKEAMSFLVRLGFHAEELNHHPEIRNVYNRVDLALTTHDAGGEVTEKDLELARAIQGFSWVG